MDVRWCCCIVGRSGEGDRGMTCVYCAGPHALSECPMWRAVWMPPAVDRAASQCQRAGRPARLRNSMPTEISARPVSALGIQTLPTAPGDKVGDT